MPPADIDIGQLSRVLGRELLFSRLSKADLDSLASAVTLQKFESGQLLIEEGTRGDCAYIILDGQVEITREGIVLTKRGPGAFLGELSLLDDAPRSATIKALGHVVSVCLTRSEFERLLLQPTMARGMLLALTSKLREGVVSHVETSKAAVFLRDAFARYVSEEVLSEISTQADPSSLLKGRLATATILFSDIRGFTTFSEQMTPAELVDLLTVYFGRMIDVVTQSRGFINKFIGDALLVLFGLPLAQPDAQTSAARAALDMIASLKSMNEPRIRDGLLPVEIGIGIHTGEVIVGNIGDLRRMEYTVIGDNVNLCSRLEGLTKFYGVPIILSQPTRDGLSEDLEVRPLDVVRVKGKKKPTRIFELCGERKSMPAQRLEFNRVFETTLDLYLEARFKEARQTLEARPEAADDGPSQFLLARCVSFERNPPPENWDGSFEMLKK